MLSLLIGAALAHAVAAAGGGEPADAVPAADGRLWASQIAEVPAPRDAVIAIMPEGADEVAMGEEVRRGLIRNRYPRAPYRLRHDGPLRVVRAAAPAVAGADCAAARVPIGAGAHVVRDDLSPIRCERRIPGGWLGYDAVAGSFFARRAIPAGTPLGRVPVRSGPSAAAGAKLVYRTSEGPVTVEREVTALQSGRAGHPVFVRTEDGKVLSAVVAGAEETP